MRLLKSRAGTIVVPLRVWEAAGQSAKGYQTEYCSLTIRHSVSLLCKYVFMVAFFPLDIFSIGFWPQLKELEDPNLKSLASNLPSTILQCKAISTTRKYFGGFRRWKQWATNHKISVVPAEPCQVALYLQHLGESKQSKASVKEAVNCLSWAHTLAGLVSPMADPLVRATLEGLKRACAKPVQKKAPFSTEMLQAIVQDARKSNRLADIRLATVCLLAFAGMMNWPISGHVTCN